MSRVGDDTFVLEQTTDIVDATINLVPTIMCGSFSEERRRSVPGHPRSIVADLTPISTHTVEIPPPGEDNITVDLYPWYKQRHGEVRRHNAGRGVYYVYTPPLIIENGLNTEAKVVFVFDGSEEVVVENGFAMDRLQAEANSMPVFIIGIPSNFVTREYDLTPWECTGMSCEQFYADTTGGGGEATLSFIENDLEADFLRRYYDIDIVDRAIAGASLGGLMSLYATYTRSGRYSACIALSPSLWYNDGYLIQQYAFTPLTVHTPMMVTYFIPGDSVSVVAPMMSQVIEQYATIIGTAQPTNVDLSFSTPQYYYHIESDFVKFLPTTIEFLKESSWF